jgi:hypothetical protein
MRIINHSVSNSLYCYKIVFAWHNGFF